MINSDNEYSVSFSLFHNKVKAHTFVNILFVCASVLFIDFST